jgi:hypothetical protein
MSVKEEKYSLKGDTNIVIDKPQFVQVQLQALKPPLIEVEESITSTTGGAVMIPSSCSDSNNQPKVPQPILIEQPLPIKQFIKTQHSSQNLLQNAKVHERIR